MKYKVEIHFKDGDTSYAHFHSYSSAREYVGARLEDKYVSAAMITNELTGTIRFKRARDANGLRWIHERTKA